MTRRSLLKCASLVAPATQLPRRAKANLARKLGLAHEGHLLAVESARGYRTAIGGCIGPDTTAPIILAGLRNLTARHGRDLFDRVGRGHWVLIESGLGFAPRAEASYHRDLMRDLFGLRLGPTVSSPQLASLYVNYQWPVRRAIRHFSEATEVLAEDCEVMAHIGKLPVAVRKQVGEGGVIYLGTSLGPILNSEDRDAVQLAVALANHLAARL